MQTQRPPVIVIMGHVDHGKSALLDYIRNSNVVENEAGGITQHINAYEITKKHEGTDKKITFIDTPGHAAFSQMRARGAKVADIAILVVSAEDGVKAQTLEALSSIQDAKIPYIIAINKIDLPNADIQKTKNSLIENGIYIEGMGGDVPAVSVSAKTGEGIDELLDTVLLVAEMEELSGDTEKRGSGVVIESHRDNKRGISATLIIKDGTIRKGDYIVAGTAMAPVRIMEDFSGKSIDGASFSSPVLLAGFDDLPDVGSVFTTFTNKKDATLARSSNRKKSVFHGVQEQEDKFIMPIILKTDTVGSSEAIIHEFDKMENDYLSIRVLKQNIGVISEDDIKTAISVDNAIVIGFNTSADPASSEMARQHKIQVKTFKIIYELTEWLKKYIDEIRPKFETERVVGEAKVLAHFSSSKKGGKVMQTVGGSVLSGQMRAGNIVKIFTYDNQEKGTGEIITLKIGKEDKNSVNENQEFGAMIQTDVNIEKGDKIHCIEKVLV